ncbi:MAG: cytochrome D1 domain-containing protein, partial [Parvularculaceae bacterium]
MRAALFIGSALLALSATAHADTLVVGNKVEHTASFIDLVSGEERARPATGRAPHEIAVSPDGKTAVLVSYRELGYDGNALHVFDVATATKTAEISLGDHIGPHGLKWIPGTTRVIATTEVTKDVVIVDIAARKVVGSVKTDQDGSHMVALSKDARRAFIANIGAGSFTVVDLETMTKVKDVTAGEGTEAIAVSPDGALVWVGNNDSRSVMIFDAASLEKVGEFKTEGVPIRVELSPDGKVAVVSEPDRARVSVYDATTYTRGATVPISGAFAPVSMLFSPGGERLCVA